MGLLWSSIDGMQTGTEPALVTPTELRHRLQRQGDTIVLVNLWATWCRPCIEKLPSFDTLAHRYRDMPVRVWLVNVEPRAQWAVRVKPFLARRRLIAPVFLLEYGKGTRWLDTIHTEWSGTLPATILWRAADSLSVLIEGETRVDTL
ncbi:MAG: TlpA family protein disulfide reductase, partial [Candidatus Kapabacteria bacterium]|nr:TlpA family protein disulfide reductase [Candidatus Kapabacteria bacterium]